jgi:transposase-like protein
VDCDLVSDLEELRPLADLNCTSDRALICLRESRMRRKITNETWQQIFTAYASGVGLREIARRMNILEVTVLQHAKRHRWTQQIKAATSSSNVIAPVSSGVIAPVQSVQSVPQTVAAILSERKERTKLGLSKYAAEAAEEAAEHRDKLEIAGKVKDVAGVHKTLWPDQPQTNQILNLAILTGAERPQRVIRDSEGQDSGG